MLQSTPSWRNLAVVGAIALLAGCAQTPATVASNPPPVPPGPGTSWYHIEFVTASHAIDAQGEATVADVTNFLRQHPPSIATIITKTDTVGGVHDYVHRRADAVRGARVYRANVSADRDEPRLRVANTGPDEPNRVGDIAIH